MQVRTRIALAIMIGTALTTGWVTVAQGTSQEGSVPVAPEGGDKPASPENGVCRKSFASGSGVTRFVWCFGADGSINQIEHAAGAEHTGVTEGFCISSNGVRQAVMSGDQPPAGLNAPSYPAANKVVHTTTDGAWRIEQTFTQVTATKSIVINVKLTNTSGAMRTNVGFTRFMDADMRGTPSDDIFVNSNRSVVAADPKLGIGGGGRVELLAATTAVDAFGLLFSSFRPSFDANSCHSEGAMLTPSLTGDRSMGAEYSMANVPAGASKTLQFVYRASI